MGVHGFTSIYKPWLWETFHHEEDVQSHVVFIHPVATYDSGLQPKTLASISLAPYNFTRKFTCLWWHPLLQPHAVDSRLEASQIHLKSDTRSISYSTIERWRWRGQWQPISEQHDGEEPTGPPGSYQSNSWHTEWLGQVFPVIEGCFQCILWHSSLGCRNWTSGSLS